MSEAIPSHIAASLQDAIHNLSTGFAIFDADDRIIFANRALAGLIDEMGEPTDIVGLSRAELVARTMPKMRFFDGKTVQTTPAWQQEIEDRLRGLKNDSLEVKLIGGHWRLITGQPTLEGGQVLFGADITALKTAEAGTRKREEQFRAIFEAIPLPVRVSVPGTWELLHESRAAAELFGETEPLGSNCTTIASYADEEARAEIVAALESNRRLDNREVLMKRRDGATFPAALSSRVIPVGNQDVCITSFTDLTEVKNRERELRQARETLEDAIEALSDGFVLYDVEDRLVTCNAQYKAYHQDCADLLVRGAHWPEITKARAERGLFTLAREDPEAWFAGQMAQRGKAQQEEFPAFDGRWFEYSHRPTRQGGFVSTWREVTDRRKMEDALRESEALVRQVLEACPLPVRMWNPETGRVIYESPASKRLFGRDATKVPPDERTSVYADLEERRRYRELLLQTKAVDNFEMRLCRSDGNSFWASVSARVIDFKGQTVVVSTISDLSERKQREAEARRAHETLEDAIESLPEGFALYDKDDRLILCNSRFRAFNRLSASKLEPGVLWRDFIRTGIETGQYLGPYARFETWEEHERGRPSEQGPYSLEFQQSDGRWFYSFSQRTREGGLVVIRVDITEPKQMELAIRDSEEMVRQVLKACPVPITMNRVEDGVVIYESPAAQELLRYAESQEGNSVISRWVDPTDRKPYLERLMKETSIDGLEVRFKRADGEEFPCAMSSRLIEYRGEKVIVSNLFDLTDRNAAEEELSRQREMLHQSEKLSALGELLAGVSHELNNPLSVLLGQAQMLQETALDDRTALRAEKIGKAADRCARIVKTFLAMARQEPSETVPVNINSIVEESLEVTAYGLRTSGIDLTLRLAPNLPEVYGDPDQLRQVVTNLIINAQHALQNIEGPRRLRLATQLRQGSKWVTIKVKDNGPGVPESLRGRIFEPLYTTKEVGRGTGMGLALCHRIVEAHGGTINLESDIGKGAAFAIRLPYKKTQERTDVAMNADREAAGKYRVLVVDDEYDVGEIISDVLQASGHYVEVAASGKAALEKVKRHDYDVILSDIRMPGMDGQSFYRALSALKPGQINALAFITGDTLSPNVKDFLNACERPYLEKPLMTRDIRELVELLIRRQRT